ncbi:simple sugar transport system ATP-binding protein [Halorubrum aquaticum]|uniref:Simple sugar transport system ATP-binding protein n=1 Tax=Halorubrum aquaticum TaxID=387340 RepID=A0A1I2YZQ3_9EURY|nr:ABC transporter ATP-binding protein [Halorubrum aquaticum]SFH30769.1 simple sugar transport system ATP-binding protein [Halorubrum aquaticum]
MNPAVHLDGITKRFPGVVANDDVDLAIERGSVHALLGENGAGKTTLMNVLYGLYRPTEGTVVVDGEPRSFASPRDAIDAGIGMIHQHFMLVDPMTVWENVVLGNEPRTWGGLRVDEEAAREAVVELSERYGFDVDPDATIADVSVGEQQRVEILKALYRGAEVLIMDEPTAVLTPQEVEELYGVFEELTDQGKTIIFISHKLGEALSAADEITVLRNGVNVGTVASGDVTREELAEMMVGREVLMEPATTPQEPGDRVLGVTDLRVEDDRGVEAVSGISFELRAGEVLGIAGVDGNGQSQLVEAITGMRKPTSGSIEYLGESMAGATRREHIDRGMAFVPEDRHEKGLVMSYDLVQNGILGSQHDPPFASGGRIDWNASTEHAESVIEAYDVRPPNPDADAESFSGGNQQKFIVGREFERNPDLVVATHPTRGVDIGSTEFLHERLLELRAEGKAILLVSSKLDEVQGLSDRLAVIHEGEFSGVVDPATVTEEEIGLLMAGETLADETVSGAAIHDSVDDGLGGGGADGGDGGAGSDRETAADGGVDA